MQSILDLELDMTLVITEQKYHLINRSLLDEYVVDVEEQIVFNLDEILCDILNFNLKYYWERALLEYILSCFKKFNNSDTTLMPNVSNLFEITGKLPFMFKPVQLLFLINEFKICFDKILAAKLLPLNRVYIDPSETCADKVFSGYTKFMNTFRYEIWNEFVKQNQEIFKNTFGYERLIYPSELIYLYMKEKEEYLINTQSYNDFTRTIKLYDNLLMKWQNQTNRSAKDNYKAMIILLEQEEDLLYPHGYQEIKDPALKADFSKKVINGDICTAIYNIKNLGGLLYLLFLLSSEHPTLKKCYICNSYYTESKLRMYCSNECKERDIYTKQYNKLVNTFNKNLTKNGKWNDELNELHNLWKQRKIDNDTFKNSMDALRNKLK